MTCPRQSKQRRQTGCQPDLWCETVLNEAGVSFRNLADIPLAFLYRRKDLKEKRVSVLTLANTQYIDLVLDVILAVD